MRTRGLVFLLVSVLGLALYLWGALAAPVVMWSDSRIDMDWARSGIGIWRPVPAPPPGEPLVHPPKPGYLFFLAAAMRAAPGLGPARSVVLVQSVLLWLSIVGTCWFILRRTGNSSGLWACVLLFAALRIRDSASAVMSEAISAALFLPLAALCVWRPARAWSVACAGLAAALLFAIRPDVGAMLFLMMAASLLDGWNWRPLGVFVVPFAVLTLGVWIATWSAAGADPLRGVGHPVLEASAEYYWRPALGEWPRAQTQSQMGRKELQRAAENWKRTLSRGGPDTRRELAWRAFHGLLGTEFYDARWSRAYRVLDAASRILTPYLISAFLAMLVLPSPPQARTTLAGVLLLLCVVGHNIVFGSNPRYLLPALPFLLALLTVALAAMGRAPWLRIAGAGGLLIVLVFMGFRHRELFDWQWGRIEAPGVKLIQPILKGVLPAQEPATLHLRIASPVVPSAAGLDVFGPGDRLLYTSGKDPARQRPFITIPLPAWLLEANRRGPVELSLRSRAGYGATSYLLFPVIPPPFGTPAHRDGSRDLSPSTGIAFGSLDWWAHAGPAD